jgi:hypothetical protein
MVFREIIVICFQNHNTYNTLFGENAEFVNVKAGSVHAHHFAFRSYEYNKLHKVAP